jgi:hypothetical protein
MRPANEPAPGLVLVQRSARMPAAAYILEASILQVTTGDFITPNQRDPARQG